ncbi:hypothetical protein [Aerococcus christensenii]|uniref:Uncharacterized protein n=1 Tax=Aerococcus christensenii TaxID=87541 RepID=A0A0X8F7A0_9LACT|nr:hypothetical protein [Aerococcus christensenii]AMB91860.1 hypothetical protein AWM71_00155 [Aerococcus christensenii]KXB36076.1 hypothetical protein HMPREF3187_01094 [Aerococcus christensenii]MDK8234640.1 hypothetical protein [Aerococcus christensenii]
MRWILFGMTQLGYILFFSEHLKLDYFISTFLAVAFQSVIHYFAGLGGVLQWGSYGLLLGGILGLLYTVYTMKSFKMPANYYAVGFYLLFY